MSLRFSKLARASIRALNSGSKLTEHGIVVERTAKGDLRWSIAIMVDGQRIHRVIGMESAGVTREQAERAVEALRTKAREARLDLPKGRKAALSFTEAAALYVERLKAEDGRSVARKEQHLRVRLIPHLAGKRLDAIEEADTASFAARRRGNGAKPATINRELATLSHLMRSASKWGWINRDRVPSIARLKEGAGRIIALSPEQCAALLHGAEQDQDGDLWLFVAICLQTSMRHGEARRLRWEHYDAHRRRFYIPEAKAGEREQPITAELAVTLDSVMVQRAQRKGYLFEGGPGSATGYRHTFRKAFRRAVERAGLDPAAITPHVLRHTAITKLVKAGVDLPTIQRVSGHKTLAMVLRYSHVDGVHIDNAISHLAF